MHGGAAGVAQLIIYFSGEHEALVWTGLFAYKPWTQEAESKFKVILGYLMSLK